MLTPETLPRHEWIGLPVRVAAASDPGMVGIAGSVVAETAATLSIAGADRVRTVPKRGTTFEVALTDETAGDRKAPGIGSDRSAWRLAAREDPTYVTVDGQRLLARPAARTDTDGDSIWR